MKQASTLILLVLFAFQFLKAQVTSSGIRGNVLDSKGEAIIGSVIKVIHKESGSLYGAQSDVNGNFRIVGLKVGGPYKINASYIGFQSQEFDNIYLNLGETFEQTIVLMETKTELKEVVISAVPKDPFKQQKIGSSQQIESLKIQKLPTLSRSLGDFTRLVPQGAGSVNLGSNNSPIPSFGGADVRFSNISIDGSIFNNSFGLSPTPGGQTGANFISLDAIEQIQVNISPYDVKQGGFTGAGVNMVTKSGTNTLKGTAFYNFRNNSLAGSKVNQESISLNDFTNQQFGLSIGGPIIKDKLFFFVNAEIEQRSDPGTTFKAKKDSLESGAEITRVLESDLKQLQSFLLERYGYETGAYQNYQLKTFSNKGTIKFDYNLSTNHKIVFRTNYLFSYRDIPIVNSGAVSARRDNLFSMSYENSNFRQYNNLLSFIAEINSMLSSSLSNSLKVGYTLNRDYRENENVFPLVDILKDNRNYISFGTDPFSSNNEVKTGTFQITDNLTFFKGNHTFTIGASVEHYSFKNIFTPYFQSQYIFNSLDDFYASASGDTSVILQRFRMGYSTGKAGEIPVANTRSTFASIYIQDEFNKGNWAINYGLRADLSAFAQTSIENPAVSNMTFKSATGEDEKYNTSKLPTPALLFSPRIGLAYKLSESIRLRGGTGIFTGRPAFVL